MMNDDEKEVVIVDNALLSTITKKIVRLERDNSIQKDKGDTQMEETVKRIIEGALK